MQARRTQGSCGVDGVGSVCVVCAVVTVLALGCHRAVGVDPEPASDEAPPTASADVPPPAALRAQPSSLAPVYRLLPRGEYERVAPLVGGVIAPAADSDFTTTATRISSEERLDEIASRIALERDLAVPPDLMPLQDDRLRAREIPFRGNPSDLLLVDRSDLSSGPRLFVPLGGDLMTPGNQVAIVDLADPRAVVSRVAVGVRPQRLALHPAGLVFVCNQYSDYLSILDARTGQPLQRDGVTVDIHTDFFCTDLAFVAEGDPGEFAPRILYVANRWRRSVLAYRIEIVRDAQGAILDVQQTDATGVANLDPLDEIENVGPAPSRLTADSGSRSLYVTNHRAGTVARVDLDSREVSTTFEAGAPSIDLAVVADRLFVPTLMPDRGLLAAEDADVSPLVQAAPLRVTGLDGALHEAHPGALTDLTRSYNFEDIRNGLYELDANLVPIAYYTDDVSAEPNFATEHKLLAGALPQAIVRNAAGDRLYIALGGSDLVQELAVGAGAPSLVATGRSFATRERPVALALDESRGQLHVAAWGGEVVESFDLVSGTRVAEIDLGYALPAYPATAVEDGERHFYDATWSNNGRKSCAHCHFDELVSDGVGFANGATAPTALHRVKPNHDLLTTDSYFWNGSFDHGSYRSLAFDAQIRTNCEIVLFGLVEGPASNPATRTGDAANVTSDGQDTSCRPELGVQGTLPGNFDQGDPAVAAVIAAQKAIGQAHVLAQTGLTAGELSRRIDLFSASELRLPPNPLRHRQETERLDASESERLTRGEDLFLGAGCGGCHDPANPRHPFTFGGSRGVGADWAARFAAAYAADARVLAVLPEGLPEVFLSAIRTTSPSFNVNAHLDPIDFFTPFCFGPDSCLSFEDPLEAGIDEAEETRRLDLLLRFNLADPARGFVPGNLPGQVKVNVPSLRGVWTQANLLHHGLARSVREAILAPGHPALLAGERGFAADTSGALGQHGVTNTLSAEEVETLLHYVSSIE